jgi:enoyl-CoA hydratase/carnithine racemase
MDNTGNISYRIDGPVGVITLDNPPENFLTEPEFLKESELKLFVRGNMLKGLIFTGKGRHFSSGADLHRLFEIAENKELLQRKIEHGNRLLRTIEELDIPVGAAIEGVCFGGGLEIALACHIRICSDKALFAFPEVNHNLMPGLGGIQRITKLLKGGLSYEMILGGDMMNAAKALELNIIDHIVPSGESLSYSVQSFKSLVHNKPGEVISAITSIINSSRNRNIDETIIEATRLFCNLAVKEAQRRENDST